MVIILINAEIKSNIIIEDALFKINGQVILSEDYDRIKDNYKYDVHEILEGLILETIVLQQDKVYNIQVDKHYIDHLIDEAKEMGNIYDKILETYSTVEAYREALEYRFIYEAIKEEVPVKYKEQLSFSNEIIERGMNRFFEENQYRQEDFTQDELNQIKKELKENYKTALSNIYFSTWNYNKAKEAHIDYINYDEERLLEYRAYHAETNSIVIGNQVYPLEETTVTRAERRFGGLLDLTNENLGDEYRINNLQESTDKVNSIKVLQMLIEKIGTKEEVKCEVIINPLAYSEMRVEGVNKGQVNGMLVVKNNGEYYINDDQLCISYRFYDTNMDDATILDVLQKLIKYGYTSDCISINELTEIMLIGQELTASKVEMTLEDINKYLGISIENISVVGGLKACDYNTENRFFGIDSTGDIVGDRIVNQFYTDYYDDNSPKLINETAVPRGYDISYSKINFLNKHIFEGQNTYIKSKINNCDVMIGHSNLEYGAYDEITHKASGVYDWYIAQFVYENVYYEISSKCLSEEEVIKIIKSVIK